MRKHNEINTECGRMYIEVGGGKLLYLFNKTANSLVYKNDDWRDGFDQSNVDNYPEEFWDKIYRRFNITDGPFVSNILEGPEN